MTLCMLRSFDRHRFLCNVLLIEAQNSSPTGVMGVLAIRRLSVSCAPCKSSSPLSSRCAMGSFSVWRAWFGPITCDWRKFPAYGGYLLATARMLALAGCTSASAVRCSPSYAVPPSVDRRKHFPALDVRVESCKPPKVTSGSRSRLSRRRSEFGRAVSVSVSRRPLGQPKVREGVRHTDHLGVLRVGDSRGVYRLVMTDTARTNRLCKRTCFHGSLSDDTVAARLQRRGNRGPGREYLWLWRTAEWQPSLPRQH